MPGRRSRATPPLGHRRGRYQPHELSSATNRHRPDKPAPPDATPPDATFTASGVHRVRRPPRQEARAKSRGIEERASGPTDDNDNRPQGHHHSRSTRRWCVIEHIRATAPRRALPEPPRSLSPLRPAPVRVGPTTTDPVVGCSDMHAQSPICYLVGRECIFDDVTANNSNEYVTIKVDRHVVLAYT